MIVILSLNFLKLYCKSADKYTLTRSFIIILITKPLLYRPDKQADTMCVSFVDNVRLETFL